MSRTNARGFDSNGARRTGSEAKDQIDPGSWQPLATVIENSARTRRSSQNGVWRDTDS